MKPTFLNEIAHWGECSKPQHARTIIHGASVDSRLTEPGDLFFALPGARADGHEFLQDAAGRGAKAAVVCSKYKGDSYGLNLIHADDVLLALKKIARRFVQESGSKIVAVTGSLGKTTTKEFIAALLRFKFSVISSTGNQNSQIGLPLTILNQAGNPADVFVLEMGMTHAGNITKLVEIAPPDVAVVTAIALAHACNFDSLEAIARAKAEIFEHERTKLGIYHYDSDVSNVLKITGSCEKRSFSVISEEADWLLTASEQGMRVHARGKVVDLPMLNVIGAHNRQNFLAAAITAGHFGLSWQEIAEAQTSLVLPERRLQVVEKNGITFVNDSYNACEMSVKAALSALPLPKLGGKRIAVIGEMLELGKFSDGCHKAVGEHALNFADKMICLGIACKPIYDSWNSAGRKSDVFWKENRSDVVEVLQGLMKQGDVVLLKGSRAKELWKVLDEVY